MKFLICYDGSEQAIHALDFVIKLHQEIGAGSSEFHLAYVVEKSVNIADPVPDELLEVLQREGNEILSNGARSVRKQLEVPFVHLELGSPSQKLLELADKLQPDLVVLGIAKHHPSEKILGTVSTSFFNARKYRVLVAP